MITAYHIDDHAEGVRFVRRIRQTYGDQLSASYRHPYAICHWEPSLQWPGIALEDARIRERLSHSMRLIEEEQDPRNTIRSAHRCASNQIAREIVSTLGDGTWMIVNAVAHENLVIVSWVAHLAPADHAHLVKILEWACSNPTEILDAADTLRTAEESLTRYPEGCKGGEHV